MMKNKGITLIALVITIIVLLILVGVTINMLFGAEGIITNAVESKDKTEISQEKEIISMAIMGLKSSNKGITQINLQEELNKQTGNTDIIVYDMGLESLLVKFPSKRVYEVEKDESVEYLGKEGELDEIVVVEADEESNLDPKQIQVVQITVKRYDIKATDNITIQYAWNTSETEEPKTYKNAILTEGGTNLKQSALIESGEQLTGNYYLWIKVKIGNQEKVKKTYGKYFIQEYITLAYTGDENSPTAGFLGNTNIQRGKIKSITIKNSLKEKPQDDEKCWDVGNKKQNIIFAWYEEESAADGDIYYNVTIAEEGKVAANANSGALFSNIGCNVKETVEIKGLEYLDTNGVTNMGGMFEGCSSISLDVSHFDTSSVTAMNGMFNGCSNIKGLDVSKFDTKKVTSMGGLFYGCSSLTNLDVSSFDTSKVFNMASMFYNCSSLTNLDVSNFDTSSVLNMQMMFFGCKGLKNLDVSMLKTSNVTTMLKMFSGCSGLTNLNIGKIDTSNVKSMYEMFGGCSSLTSLNLNNLNTANVTSMGYMFIGCKSLKNLDISNWNTNNVEFMNYMFAGCSALENLNFGEINTSNVTDMGYMFINCISLKSLDISNFDTSSVTYMGFMFDNCQSLTNLNLTNFDTSKVTNMYAIFYNCKNLSTLDLRNWVLNNDNDTEVDGRLSFDFVPNSCMIYVSNSIIKDWIIAKNNKFSDNNVKIVDESGNIK